MKSFHAKKWVSDRVKVRVTGWRACFTVATRPGICLTSSHADRDDWMESLACVSQTLREWDSRFSYTRQNALIFFADYSVWRKFQKKSEALSLVRNIKWFDIKLSTFLLEKSWKEILQREKSLNAPRNFFKNVQFRGHGRWTKKFVSHFSGWNVSNFIPNHAKSAFSSNQIVRIWWKNIVCVSLTCIHFA